MCWCCDQRESATTDRTILIGVIVLVRCCVFVVAVIDGGANDVVVTVSSTALPSSEGCLGWVKGVHSESE